MRTVPPPDPTTGESRPRRTGSWLLFVLALLLPAVLTLLTARSQDLWPFFTFVLGGASAIYCGFWTASLVCRTSVGRVLVGLVFSAGFYVVSFFLCCAGCTLGGASLNIH